jgi:uncharacterized protein YxjI
MTFTVKQKIMAFGKQYRVFDESGNQVYEISSMIFSPERRKDVFDMGGNLVAWSEWPVMSGQAELNAGAAHCELEIPYMSISPQWEGSMAGGTFQVQGDFMRLSFSISGAGGSLAVIDKRILAFSDTYEIDVNESAFKPEFALLITALIDHKYHSDNN